MLEVDDQSLTGLSKTEVAVKVRGGTFDRVKFVIQEQLPVIETKAEKPIFTIVLDRIPVLPLPGSRYLKPCTNLRISFSATSNCRAVKAVQLTTERAENYDYEEKDGNLVATQKEPEHI